MEKVACCGILRLYLRYPQPQCTATKKALIIKAFYNRNTNRSSAAATQSLV